MSNFDWYNYYEDLEKHELFCTHVEIAFKKVDYIMKDIVDKGTASLILECMKNELSRIRHMDAPNKPGYYRANND